jgi:hypothetical protein
VMAQHEADLERINSIAGVKGITPSDAFELVVSEMMSGRAWTFEQAFRNVEAMDQRDIEELR